MSCCLVTDSFEHVADEEVVLSHREAQLARQRVFALRFRTELCRTHATTGRCEYRDKCMFAHGQKELRTEAMNEADGLESDKAIRNWIRENRRVSRDKRTTQKPSTTQVLATPKSALRGRSIHVVNAAPIQVAKPSETLSDFAPTPTLTGSSRSSSCSQLQLTSTSPALERPSTSPAPVLRFRYNPYSMIRVQVLLPAY